MNNFHTDPVVAKELDRRARRTVRSRLGWLQHATVYVCVIGGLSLLAVVNGRHLPVAAALGWGLALALHGARVLIGGSGWRERLVEAERQRLAGQASGRQP